MPQAFTDLPMVSPEQQNDALSGMTPEQVQQLVQASYADKQRQDLERQRAQVDALRKPSGMQYTKPLGAALGGAADIIKQYSAARQDKQLQQQQQQLLQQQKGAGSTWMDAVIRSLRNKNGVDPLMPASAASGEDTMPIPDSVE